MSSAVIDMRLELPLKRQNKRKQEGEKALLISLLFTSSAMEELDHLTPPLSHGAYAEQRGIESSPVMTKESNKEHILRSFKSI